MTIFRKPILMLQYMHKADSRLIKEAMWCRSRFWKQCTESVAKRRWPFKLRPRPDPALSSTQVRHRLVHLCLQSGPGLNQKFHVIVAPNVPSVCYTSSLKLRVPDSRWCTNGSNGATPCSALLHSWAEQGFTSNPAMAKCKCTILRSAQAQHGHFC